MKYPKLFEKGKIGNVVIKNRIVMTPMGTGFAAASGEASEEITRFYEERAKGGVGLIISEVCRIDELSGIAQPCQLSATDMMQTFLPQMKSQGTHCQVINVCSIAGLINMNGAPAYFSSKHAAVSLSECVWKGLKAEGADIDVSVFCPGYIQTEMHLSDRHRPERFAIPEDDPYYKSENYAKMVAFNKSLLEHAQPVGEAVENVFKALEQEQFYIFNTDKYDRLLCEQGVFQAEKTRPVDYYTLK